MWAFFVLCSVFITHGAQGWTIGWTTQETATTSAGCGGYLYSSSDSFSSPNYPSHYPNNAYCTWYIRPNRQIIELEFFNVNTECSFDYISVYDGSSTGSRLLGSSCSANRIVFYSTSQYLTVTFRSDFSVTGTGFYATYRIVGRYLGVLQDVRCVSFYTKTSCLLSLKLKVCVRITVATRLEAAPALQVVNTGGSVVPTIEVSRDEK
ncbi:deleted in malignant brain tumors 1 protein [Austrofundulus limnaeus]|uniref:Deleted in malignant brain tumors 1 protein n=1 Tax=Austrofundulus limnaeus TaxID=52670 RepID=A0A2I4DB49_AUSLI|nr:PREDICTED: deleted in malignant brain tumors 1 protein-like [Austrofundulus limnaeus]